MQLTPDRPKIAAGRDVPVPIDRGPARAVTLVDEPITRVRRPVDLVLMVLSILGIALVMVMGVYANATTVAITQDVQNAFAATLRDVLLIPIGVVEGVLIVIVPLMVLVEQLLHRHIRDAVESAAAAGLAALLTLLGVWILEQVATENLLRTVQLWISGDLVVMISPATAALAALLTAAGTRDQSKIIALAWTLLWVVLGVTVIVAAGTIVGTVTAILAGRATGLGVRYLMGVRSRRAHGQELLDTIRRAGIDPISVVRISSQDVSMVASAITINSAIGHGLSESAAVDPPEPDPEELSRLTEETQIRGVVAKTAEPTSLSPEREGYHRVYAVIDHDGVRWDVVVMDRDQQVLGLLSYLWSTFRLGGLGRRNAVSLEQAADRAALMSYAVHMAGVNTPMLTGLARTDESVVLVGEHVPAALPFSALDDDAFTDDLMFATWRELLKAHHAGLSHRNLSAETVLYSPTNKSVLLTSWEQGDIASNSISRRLDMVQLLVMFALRVGPSRAAAVAQKALGDDSMHLLAPMIQGVALPPTTRSALAGKSRILQQVREQLVEIMPDDASAEPIRLTRFSARTVITATIAMAALWLVFTSFNFREIASVIAEANVAWMIVAFGVGSLAFVGSAMGLVGLAPGKLNLWHTFVVQVAASVVNLVTPAAMGPAALNLRLLQRAGTSTALSVATVGLLQVSQFLTSVVLLVVIALATGSQGALSQLPSGALITLIITLAVLVGAALLIPALRGWLGKKLGPTMRQVWPRVVWILGQPRRIVITMAGNILQNLAYLGSFAAALYAFGATLPVATLVIVYLTGTAVGSLVPTPGGIGTVELALSTGLRTAGISTAIAAPTAVLFRVTTFWIRIPLGWLCLRYLQKRNII